MLQKEKNTLEVLLQTDFLPFAHLQMRGSVFLSLHWQQQIYICIHVAEEGSEGVKSKGLSRLETFRRSGHGSKSQLSYRTPNHPQTFLRWKRGVMDHPTPISERFGWFENLYHNHNFNVIVPKERKCETTTCSTGIFRGLNSL